MPKSLQNYDFLTSDNKLSVNMNSLTGQPQNEFIIVILNMVLWFFFEFLQYVINENSGKSLIEFTVLI